MDASSTKLVGGIDALSGGILSGWAADLNSEKSISIAIYCNNKLVGSGVAETLRPDLKQANINAGLHGFKLEIDTTALEDNSTLELRELESDIPLETNEFEVGILAPSFWAEAQSVNGNQFLFSVSSNAPIQEKTLEISCDGEVVCEHTINSQNKSVQDHVWLPAKVLDNQNHLLEISIKGVARKLGGAYFTLKPVLTPWMYLKDSHKKPGFMSLPKQADRRYEALHYQLESSVKGNSPIDMKSIVTAHGILVEGYEDRKKFPAFSLPKFDKPKVSIIVPAYNKFELTYHCIASVLLAYNKTSYEVILADDCSTDETSEAESIIENLVVSRNPENLRFLRSCNRATELATGDYIIFLNNDTEVSSFWIDELIEKHKEDETIGLTGSKLLNLDGSMQEAGGIVWGNGQPWNVGRDANPLQPEFNYAREVDYVSGAAMCISKSVWEEVGYFSEELVPCYYEDTDLAFKVRDAGYKTVYVPTSEVVHFEGQSHGTDVTKGLKRYQVVNEKTFRNKWFKAFKHNGKASLENLKIEKDRNIDQRILVIDYASPQPNKDAGSYAAIQEIKLMLSLGFKVTFVPENLAHFGKYTSALQKMGVEVLYAPFYTSMDDVLARRLDEMDAVYITRYYVAEAYLQTIKAKGKKVIFNNADLHFLREMRAALQNGKDDEKLTNALETRVRELRVCNSVDAILTYNATEHAVITSHILDAEKLHITPWVLEEKQPGPSFDEREGIVFLGGFNHTPNVECVEFLAKDIMPLLAKQRPDITLYVYGSNMPDEMKEFECDNIKMVGFAEHLDDVFHNHRVFVAPLLSGAGIKGKVLESMAYGLPTVLTDVAAEGTGLTHGISTLIAEKTEEWVDAIVQLYDDKVLWHKFAENQLTLVESNFSFSKGRDSLRAIFSSVGIYSDRY
ncbi:MAG: glycosyltransferase [Alteromonas stellipolaris]|uniref:glycosyltransferase n=1 Tax=Alteromonas stellipolaris TaxID=233316 RepID=UPI003B8E3B21